MIAVELLVAIALGRYGGGLTVSDEPGEQIVGWIFLGAGLCVAAAVGAHL